MDTITALASSKVRVRIADMTTNSWVFDSGYGSNGEYQSPAAGGNVSTFLLLTQQVLVQAKPFITLNLTQV